MCIIRTPLPIEPSVTLALALCFFFLTIYVIKSYLYLSSHTILQITINAD